MNEKHKLRCGDPERKCGKFAFEPESGRYKLQKTLPAGAVFPFDFGFIPGTVGGAGGKPLEVIMISETATFTGCAIDCRIIGGIKARYMKQEEEDGMRNNCYIAIPEASILYKQIDRISRFSPQLLQELEGFLLNYNDQAGKR